MALTPEDVVNKRFQPTKFREGYDQDEVDDFLDEVVVELRRLGQENLELRQQLSEAESQAGARSADSRETRVEAPAPVVVPVAAPAAESDQDGANNLLQLARRLHDEHVKEGIAKRDALIAEGEEASARLVTEADARQKAKSAQLNAESAKLESDIADLRSFESEYRAKLKSYIEGQLRDLDDNGLSTDPSGVSHQGVASN